MPNVKPKSKPGDILGVSSTGCTVDGVTTSLSGIVPDSASPLVTFYDLATGERVELSGITFGNWVTKTANYLIDELEVEPETRIRIGLPAHWLRPVWTLAAWSARCAVVDRDAEIGVVGPELDADEPIRLAASLRPLGTGFASPPDGFTDVAAVVPAQSDLPLWLDDPEPADLALELGGAALTQAELAETAGEGRRLLVTDAPLADEIRLLIAACLGGGSLVIAVNAAEAAELDRIADQERAVRLPPD